MLDYRADGAHHQGGPCEDEPEVSCAHCRRHAERRRHDREVFFVRTIDWHPVRQKPQVGRRRARDPDPDGEEHHQDEQSNALERMAPAVVTQQEIDEQRGEHATEPQAEIRVAHGAAAAHSKPASDQHLIRDRAREHVANDLGDAEQLVVPELRHRPHQQQRQPDEADSSEDHRARPDAVDQRACQEPERQTDQQKSKQESLRDLRAREAERLHQRGIEHREPIKDDADAEKQVQKCGGDNPPAVEDARWLPISHGASFSRTRGRESRTEGPADQGSRSTRETFE